MKEVKEFIKQVFDSNPIDFSELNQAGSDRKYFRFFIDDKSYIAVYNHQIRENEVFFEMSVHFKKNGIRVPDLISVSDKKDIYILQDLGDISLFDHLAKNRTGKKPAISSINLYREALDHLAEMQIIASKGYNYDFTRPVKKFDKQAILWDLNYFKYYYALPSHAPYDEYRLQKDFEKLSEYLLHADSEYFMFRDFQSRNIMIFEDKPWFIDYQGGRKGALQYDLASILWQARANLPEDIKQYLLESYIKSVKQRIDLDEEEFISYYEGFVLIRVLQTLGAYGFRGLFEKRTHFMLSIPLALKNLQVIQENFTILDDYPELKKLVSDLLGDKYRLIEEELLPEDRMTVKITSFSYKRGVPIDTTGHGGGHVFDCRAIHNPGRYDEYKKLKGMDQPVIEFLDKTEEMQDFLKDVKSIVVRSIEKYRKRNFNYISISFGCTGGQHRSVYSAEKLAAFVKNNFSVKLVLKHREQESKME